ncbi:MAG: inositol-3-phosphate synthase [Planctomycetota bacterium]|nr:inositol-3-phosphate synthase [Planctomycetota bacterium]
MSSRRVGLWLVGAHGGVATTITLGLAAMSRGLSSRVGLVSDLPLFEALDPPDPSAFVVGGHEIRSSSYYEAAQEFRRGSGALESEVIAACRAELDAATSRVRPGTALGAGPAVARLVEPSFVPEDRSGWDAVERIAADIEQFRTREALDHVIVLNVSSTEPTFATTPAHERWSTFETALRSSRDAAPPSTLYAVAALRGGHSHVNFTPSLGADIPALAELAATTGSIYAGKDGKTGETLMKTVLAPMFAARNLRVLSWVGHNIFGNRDGVVLDDPVHKASKVETKDKVVSGILGYKPKSLVTIEYIPDMGDWKTAWDHIHFEGFLGVKMSLQFTWQGCDSLLAAPLAIDLARLVDAEKRRGGRGPQPHLASFFKNPADVETHDFFEQFLMLVAYARRARLEEATAR